MKFIEISSLENKELYRTVKDAIDQYGVVLLRGLQLGQIEFESFTQMFCDKFYRVSSRESLRMPNGDGFTTLTFQENFFLFAHSDGTYAPYPLPPDIGFLMCIEMPSVLGGETTMIDGVEMLNSMSKELRERFIYEKITYEFLWEPERWHAQFRVSSENKLITLLNSLKNIKYTLNDGWLHMFYTTSAVNQMSDGSLSFSVFFFITAVI